MQTTPNVQNTQAGNASSERTNSSSTANPYDRFSHHEDESIQGRFSAIFSSLKTKFTGAESTTKRENDFANSMSEANRTRADQNAELAELKEKEKQEEEDKRKVRERRDSLAETRVDSLEDADERLKELNSEADELKALSEFAVSASTNAANGAAATAGNASSATSTSSADSNTRTKGMRPSDLLAARMSGNSTSAASTASASASASGAGVGSGSGAATAATANLANTATSPRVANTVVGSGATSASDLAANGSASGQAVGTASGVGSGAGGTGTGANAEQGGGSSFNVAGAGYGDDVQSNSAQAAAQMLGIDGVESDATGERLQQWQRNNFLAQSHGFNQAPVLPSSGTMGSINTQGASGAQGERGISQLGTTELKQRLDVLARESNVSKLSLQMTNPERIASEAREAQKLAQMAAASKDAIASLTQDGGALARLKQVPADGVNGGIGGVGGVSGVGGAATTTLTSISGNVADAQKVAAIGTRQVETSARTSTEMLMQQQRVNQESHGLVDVRHARTASARAEVAAQSFAQQTELQLSHQGSSTSIAAAMASGTAESRAGLAQLDSQHAAQQQQQAQQGNIATQQSAREDLMRLAGQAQAQATSLGQGTAQRANAALSEMAVANTGSAALNQAITSLQQSLKNGSAGSSNGLGAGVGAGAGAATSAEGTTYHNSILASMIAEGAANAARMEQMAKAVAAASSSSGVQLDQRSSNQRDSDNAKGLASVGVTAMSSNAAQTQSSLEAQAQNEAMAAQAQAEAEADLRAQFNNLALGASAADNAAAIHERVMQMAARNLKHLAVDLNPNGLGKMRISFDLSANNEALSVSLAAASASTRELLEKTLPVLQERLAAQGVATDAEVTDLEENIARANAVAAATKAAEADAANALAVSGAATGTANSSDGNVAAEITRRYGSVAQANARNANGTVGRV